MTNTIYQKAVAVCQRAPRARFKPLPKGRLAVRGNNFECRAEGLSSALPLLVEKQENILDPGKIILPIEGQTGIASLSAIVARNYPGFSHVSSFKQTNLRALSPTARFWLAWSQTEETEKALAIVSLKGRILYGVEVKPGLNELFMAQETGGRLVFTGPFTAGLSEVVSPEEPFTRLGLYLLFLQPENQGIKLDLQVFASRMGNFEAALSQ